MNSTDSKGPFILNSSPTFKGYYYQESDNNFHYFSSKCQFSGDKSFKLNADELNIISQWDFNSKEIRVGLLKTQKKFGSHATYDFYVVP